MQSAARKYSALLEAHIGVTGKALQGDPVSRIDAWEKIELECCVNHPERETAYTCMKHNIYMCAECMYCRDPEIYCKFRSSCTIHFLTQKKGNLDSEHDTAQENSSDQDICEKCSDRKC